MLSELRGPPLEPWDVAFYAERLKQEKLELAEEELRPYFPLPRVLDGLFKLVGTLFDLTRRARRRRPTSGTTTCATTSSSAATAALVGSFFTDLFARPNKRGGAWMDDCMSRAKLQRASQAARRLPRLQLHPAGRRHARRC